jgi:hypothetical protein
MLELQNITAITYDGRQHKAKYADRYKYIYDYLNEHIRFHSIKFYLTYEIPGLPVIEIQRCDTQRYNDWCIYDLHQCFNTDYVLIFQNDGFVLNPHLWDARFLTYDYIGAPWPDYLGWKSNVYKVGNGGFSLRSKKLCEFVKKLPRDSTNEDTKICSKHRSDLDSAGLKIAPVEIARLFSIENPFDSDHNLEGTFGYHGNQHEHALRQKFPSLPEL